MKQRKWSGQPYDRETACTAGSMALFCATCPQPGVNLPEDWQQDPDREAYIRMFAMDGNFTAVHQKRHNAMSEQRLTDGELYMVSEKRYHAHLASTVEVREVSPCSPLALHGYSPNTLMLVLSQPMTCNEHHALKDRFLTHKGLDVTGIGATACARHGCFCPGSVVNFVKGES